MTTFQPHPLATDSSIELTLDISDHGADSIDCEVQAVKNLLVMRTKSTYVTELWAFDWEEARVLMVRHIPYCWERLVLIQHGQDIFTSSKDGRDNNPDSPYNFALLDCSHLAVPVHDSYNRDEKSHGPGIAIFNCYLFPESQRMHLGYALSLATRILLLSTLR